MKVEINMKYFKQKVHEKHQLWKKLNGKDIQGYP